MTDRKPPTELHAAAAQWLFSVGSDGKPLLGVTVMPATGDSPVHDTVYMASAALLMATHALRRANTLIDLERQMAEERVAQAKTPVEEAQLFLTRMSELMRPGVTLQISASPHGRVTINNIAHGATIFEALDAYFAWQKRRKG